jgi:hypothetical protein
VKKLFNSYFLLLTLNMYKGIFITGTDTGVGKTFVARGLLLALKEMVSAP